MKGRDILKGLTEAQKPLTTSSSAVQARPSGSVRALKSELDKIADEAASGRELRALIEKEGRIVEIDPSSIDGASISDRIPLKNDEQFELLKAAIRDAGQQVPILVRVNPVNIDRFQAAYGHRRLRAASELGIKIKAIVHELTDQQMVMAQGQENGPRLDLSFIERALYASRLLGSGYDRGLVCSALGVDKPEVSRLLQVADGIAQELIMAIGPARKIGRPRWVALTKALQNRKILDAARTLIESESFQAESDSNNRFEKLLSLKTSSKSKTASPKQMKVALKGTSNRKLGWSQKTKKGLTLNIEDKQLSEFILENLPDLLAEFEKRSSIED